jgi:Neutral/alkaline non-lysosomal ceramidase, N-terminal
MLRPLLLVLLFLPNTVFAAEPQLSVGFGEVDVSPVLGRKPVLMAGFGQDRRATKIHDPIMARAIVFSDGKSKIGMVCVDVIGLFLPSVENIRKQLPGYQYLLVSSTHNHEGPDTLGLWGPNLFTTGVDREYLKQVEEGAAKAIQLAASHLTPTTAELGVARGGELLNDSRKPIVKHDEIVVLRFTNSNTQKPLGLLVQWNCHPETLDSRNTEVSSDFVGYTVDALREAQLPGRLFHGNGGWATLFAQSQAQKRSRRTAPGWYF